MQRAARRPPLNVDDVTVDQAARAGLRRRQNAKPPRAANAGRPAPAIGPGTAVAVSDKSSFWYSWDDATVSLKKPFQMVRPPFPTMIAASPFSNVPAIVPEPTCNPVLKISHPGFVTDRVPAIPV